MTAHLGEIQAFRVSDRLTCEFSISAIGMCCEWYPEPPEQLTDQEFAAYRAARNEVIGRWAQRTGMRAMVVEL